MQVDQNPLPIHTLELRNPKVLIQPHQAESAKEKHVIIGEEKHEKKVLQNQTSRVVAKPSTLRGGGEGKARRKKPTTSRPVRPVPGAV
jgi:hypothetical protein